MNTEYHREVLAQLRAEAATPAYRVPPPVADTLGCSIVDFLPMRSIHCEFPVTPAQDGLGGHSAFGHIMAAADVTVSLLGLHVCGHPTMPISFTMRHLRSLEAADASLTVEAKLLNRTKSLVYVEVKVWNSSGRAVAAGEAVLTVTKPGARR
ncbi:MAG: hypothetical protein GC168_12170 [Candidatus Hydrogenedens sp.]|nr:hypothetical protein [Candidatus Hydrogenedens sp.]